MKKIVILLILFLGICTIPAGAKEHICGSLESFVYNPRVNSPQAGCLYNYDPYSSNLILKVQQVINGGVLVTGDNNYYGGYFPETKTIFVQTSKQFVDDQWMKEKEIVKYMGVYSYTTVLGARKSVYKFYRYGKNEYEKYVDEFDLQKYGYKSWKEKPQIKITEVTVNNGKNNQTYSYIDIVPSNSVQKTSKVKQNKVSNADKYFKELKKAESDFKNNLSDVPNIDNDIKFEKLSTNFDTIAMSFMSDENNGLDDEALIKEYMNGSSDPETWNSRAKEIYNKYKENGFIITFSSGGLGIAADDRYLEKYYSHITPAYKEWLNFKKESENDYWDSCLLSREEIVNKILFIENFANNNPKFFDVYDVNKTIRRYIMSYFTYSDNFKYLYRERKLTNEFIESLKSFPKYYYVNGKKRSYLHKKLIDLYYWTAKISDFYETEMLKNTINSEISNFKVLQ